MCKLLFYYFISVLANDIFPIKKNFYSSELDTKQIAVLFTELFLNLRIIDEVMGGNKIQYIELLSPEITPTLVLYLLQFYFIQMKYYLVQVK